MTVTEKITAFIEGSREMAVDLEREMCARPAVSPESGGAGELDKAEYIESFLRKEGITDLVRIDAPDKKSKGGVRPNLIATIPGKSPEQLWVISHLDVVPPGDLSLWTGDPWKLAVNGDAVTGRGVEDNQQGICSSIIAALSLVKNGVQPERTLKLLFAADEENGSEAGIAYLINYNNGTLFKAGDMAVIPDSGNSEGSEIEIAEKNLLWLKASVEGKQAHGSRPDLGVNAHAAQAELALALRGLYRKFPARDRLFDPPFSSFEPTKLEANVPNVNTIPGSGVFFMDCRVLPRYPLAGVLAAAEKIARRIEKKCGVKVTLEPCQMQESPATPLSSPLVSRLSASIERVLGVKPHPIGIGGGTVAAYLRRAGLDSAVWSKLSDNAHKVNETALLSNIIDEAKVFADLFAG